MHAPQTSDDAETRVTSYTHDSNLAWVVVALEEHRDAILARWLDAATSQPFHQGHREHAVADHIPALFDALIALLARSAPSARNPAAPLNDPAILAAARGHALVRVEQGLAPVDVLTEFRLLRQELWHALRLAIPDSAPSSDVVGAELLINDALDGASALALAALTERIEQVREEFLATIVHDLRQPLTKIRGYAQLAGRNLDRPAQDLTRVSSGLTRIVAATDEMQALLTTLVDASRTALGALVLHPARTDLAELLRETVAQLLTDDTERVAIHIQPGLDTTGWWDRDRLGQVLTNLLANAEKYSPPGAPIAVTVDGDAASVRMSLQDEGIGIATDDLPQLFDRYFRAHSATEQGIEGLGLGLYLCRGIITAHGGQIEAASAGPGQGTTIRFILPRHPEHGTAG
ncbi:MAG: HAMP domain-containing histidine kinase [Chloroflexota bacterium]|nr:HAMP domain-containing histidine kinase [Chloroflexota bacterium]MDQ6907838.1 HAMP domain-containing histidine kinase [Chloroflexota bacterium]